MQLNEIIEGIKSGTITVESNQHNSLSYADPKSITKEIKKSLKGLAEHIEEMKDDEYYADQQHRLYRDYDNENGSVIGLFSYNGSCFCWDCGRNVKMFLKQNVIYLVKEYIPNADVISGAYNNQCDLHTLDRDFKNEGIVNYINVPSGKLLFRNYFDKKDIYENPKSCRLSGIKDQLDLAEYLAGQNIGYGQMGNMSIVLFKKNDNSEIILSEEYCYIDDEETLVEFDGYTNMGSISLSVWRWMCGDLEVLAGHGEEYNEKQKVDTSYEDDDYKTHVLLGVKPGKWKINHYMNVVDTNKRGKKPIFAKLSLIEE